MSNFINVVEKTITIPRGDGTGSDLTINVAGLMKAITRIGEIAYVNQGTQAELCSTFNKFWLECARAVTSITAEKVKAETTRDDAYKMALLAVTDKRLEELGHKKTSADLRAALASQDPTYVAARDRCHVLEAALHYMKDRKEAFEKAFTAVKKLVGQLYVPDPRPNGERPPGWDD